MYILGNSFLGYRFGFFSKTPGDDTPTFTHKSSEGANYNYTLMACSNGTAIHEGAQIKMFNKKV